MTQYTLRVTIAAPAGTLGDCNALALCLGESPSDINTFTRTTHADIKGNEYAVVSTVAKPVFEDMALSPLVAPPYSPDADIRAASRAQSLLNMGDKATPEHVTAIIGSRHESARDHIDQMGLIAIPHEEDY